jgi:hypothetical protein
MAPTQSRWIVSARFDLTIFIFSALVTLGPWIAVDHYGVQPFYILAAVAIFSNGPHLVSTWTRVYLDGRERFRRPFAYYAVPLLLSGMVLSFLLVDGLDSPWLRTILFYWASWHFAAQCWGLLKIYQRKQGVVGTTIGMVEKILLFGGTGWCVLHRIFTGPWSLFGVPIWHPYPPAWVVNGVGALVLTLAIAYLGFLVGGAVRARQFPEVRRALMIGSSVGAFAVPFLLIHDGTAAFAAAACWHGIQYLGIVWFFNRNRYADGVDEKARLVSWVSQKGRTPLYAMTLLAIAGLVYGGLLGAAKLTQGTSWTANTWGLFLWTSLTFSHYWLDGVIWKLRKDKTLTERLQAA